MQLEYRNYSYRDPNPEFGTPELVKREYERVDGETVKKITRSQRISNAGSIALGLLATAMITGGVFLLARAQGNRGWIGGGIFLTTFSLFPAFGIYMTQFGKQRDSYKIYDTYSLLHNHETDPNVAYYAFMQNQDSIYILEQVFFYVGIFKGKVKISDETIKTLDFKKIVAKFEELGKQGFCEMDIFVRNILNNTINLKERNPTAYNHVLSTLGKHFTTVQGNDKNTGLHTFNVDDLQFFPNLTRAHLAPTEYSYLEKLPEKVTTLTLEAANLYGKVNNNSVKNDTVKNLTITGLVDSALTISQIKSSFTGITNLTIEFSVPITKSTFQAICNELASLTSLKKISFNMIASDFSPTDEAAAAKFKCQGSSSYLNNVLTINLG